MTELSLLHAIETRSGLINEESHAVLGADTEQRTHALIELARNSIQRQDTDLLEAVFVGCAGVPADFASHRYVMQNEEALREELSTVRADVMSAFVEADPRRAAECLTRYAGHRSEWFFRGDHFASTFAIRALCRLGDSPEDRAFLSKVFPHALRKAAAELMDGESGFMELARDAAALLTKLGADPAHAADVDAAAQAIIRGLRESSGSAEHIAIYERALPTIASASPERPASKPVRGKPASHDR